MSIKEGKPAVPAASKNAYDPRKAYSDLQSRPTQSRSGKNLKTSTPSKDVPKRKVC